MTDADKERRVEAIADDPEALAAIMLLKSRGYTSGQVSLYMRCVVREVKPDVI